MVCVPVPLVYVCFVDMEEQLDQHDQIIITLCLS